MKTVDYLFGFKGRINRAKIWLFILIVIAAELVAFAIAAFGLDWSEFLKSFTAQIEANKDGPLDFSTLAWPHIGSVTSIIAMSLIGLIFVAYVWSCLAVYAKRLHDRNRSAWWLLAYTGLPLVLHGYAYSTVPGPCKMLAEVTDMSTLGATAYGIASLIGLWVFIDLFILKGTTGSNKYGVDPLAKGPVFCEPGKPVHGCVPKK